MFMHGWLRSVGRLGSALLLVMLLTPLWPLATVRAATYTVTNVGDCDVVGCGSLRAALIQAEQAPVGGDTIVFAIPGGGVQTITPSGTQFRNIPRQVTVDATTQPGYAGTPLIQLNGASAPTNSSAFVFTGNGITIKGFAINGWTGPAGVAINIASSNNTIQANFIGTDPTGTASVPNTAGIYMAALSRGANASNNVIGGTTAATRNVISGNDGIAIALDGTNGGVLTNNRIQGNYIGVNAAGNASVPNPHLPAPGSNKGGIDINAASNNLVGGTVSGAGNVISANVIDNNDKGTGIVIEGRNGPATGNMVQGNFIGTDATGTVGIRNNAGVYIDTASGNVIGGTSPAARNIISKSNTIGVTVDGSFLDATGNSATGNTIEGNYIGTDVTGTVAIPNNAGVSITAANSNVIGGTTPGAGNLISGNINSGIVIESQRDTTLTVGTAGANLVQGNLIGTTAAGTAPLGNQNGIAINGGITNTIGGSATGARNIIFGFTGAGVSISSDPAIAGSSAVGNSVVGNNIGTDINNNGASSTGKGVLMQRASNNFIGGLNTGEGNTIANREVGVQVDGSTGSAVNNRIERNAIYNNSFLNIWLSNGGNNLQAAPALTGAASSGPNQITVSGSLNSTGVAPFHIEFFSTPTATSQGKVFLSAISRNGGAFSASITGAPTNQYITATATDNNGNTSQFSNPVAITAGPPASVTPNPGTTPQSVIAGNAFNPLTVTVRDANGNAVGAGVLVTFTAPSTGASGTFANNSTTIQVQTDANGVASAPFTSNLVGGTYRVTASVPGASSAIFVLTNAPRPAPPPRPGPPPVGMPNVEPPSRGGPSVGGHPAPAPAGR